MKDKPNLINSLTLFLLFQILWGMCHSQNLIPNPSFEFGKCPTGFTRKPAQFRVDDWILPDSGTPDYYHRCSKKEAGVPYNWSGARDPGQGDAYLGIYLKKGMFYQENVGVQLRETLIRDQTYTGRFFLATAANTDFLPCEISIALTHEPLKIVATKSYDYRQITLEIPPHDEFMDYSWKVLEFTYTASGDENYFYIASLFDEVKYCGKNSYRYRKEPMLNNASYVYLDDFYLGTEEDYQEAIPVFEFAKEIAPLNVYFNFDEDILLPGTLITLDSIADYVLQTEYHLLVTGGTDSLGTEEYNRELGLKRAQAVREYLIFKGVNPGKTGIKSIGENNPIYPNHSEESRSLNRTVLIEFYKESEGG